jgi:hypothetical protein
MPFLVVAFLIMLVLGCVVSWEGIVLIRDTRRMGRGYGRGPMSSLVNDALDRASGPLSAGKSIGDLDHGVAAPGLADGEEPRQ